MLPQTTPDHPTTRKHREAKRNPPKLSDRHSNDFGDTILFVMLVGIVIALAVIMNNAIRETFFLIRDALAL